MTFSCNITQKTHKKQTDTLNSTHKNLSNDTATFQARWVFFRKIWKAYKKNCTDIFKGPIKFLGTQVFFLGRTATGNTEIFKGLTCLCCLRLCTKQWLFSATASAPERGKQETNIAACFAWRRQPKTISVEGGPVILAQRAMLIKTKQLSS